MNNLQEVVVSEIIRKAVMDCLGMDVLESNAEERAYELFHSPAALALKQEIVRAGKKLWDRQYVDGNGGNITARLSPRYIVCTPTLCSKGDLCIEDLSLVDLENRQICGDRRKSSEIQLHLEIYKTVPKAHAVIHCHPPYATAHAIAGIAPQGNLVPEQEVFVGQMALAPYETPGTPEFARTVTPLAKQHNTILLSNHGIVCWADTVTHAEWYVEVAETYCKTVVIASQLQPRLSELPENKIQELLNIKAALGLPDARLPLDSDHAPGDAAGLVGTLIDQTPIRHKDRGLNSLEYLADVERLIDSVTAQVSAILDHRSEH